MKLGLCVLAATMVIGSASTLAEAKGCVKGAIVGGVAGHVVGHHGLAGAAVGCAVGHHSASVKEQQAHQAAASESMSGRKVDPRAEEPAAPPSRSEN